MGVGFELGVGFGFGFADLEQVGLEQVDELERVGAYSKVLVR